MAHIVVGHGRSHAGSVSVGGGHPAVTVDIVVVGAHISVSMDHTGVGAVGRDIPCQRGSVDIDSEAQVLCCVVHPTAAVEPYAFKVERHVNLVAGIGIPTVDPELIVGGVYTLHPDLVDEHIGGQLILVAEINHHLVLGVEVADGSHSLAVGEVVYRSCGDFEAQESHNYKNCNAFHKALVFLFHLFSTAKVRKLSQIGQKSTAKIVLL